MRMTPAATLTATAVEVFTSRKDETILGIRAVNPTGGAVTLSLYLLPPDKTETEDQFIFLQVSVGANSTETNSTISPLPAGWRFWADGAELVLYFIVQ